MTTEQLAAKDSMKANFWDVFWQGVITGLLISTLILATIYYFADDFVS